MWSHYEFKPAEIQTLFMHLVMCACRLIWDTSREPSNALYQIELSAIKPFPFVTSRYWLCTHCRYGLCKIPFIVLRAPLCETACLAYPYLSGWDDNKTGIVIVVRHKSLVLLEHVIKRNTSLSFKGGLLHGLVTMIFW